MIDRTWLDAAKGDIPQWAASMPKDADGTTIDWDWVRSLDLMHGIGVLLALDAMGPAIATPPVPSTTH